MDKQVFLSDLRGVLSACSQTLSWEKTGGCKPLWGGPKESWAGQDRENGGKNWEEGLWPWVWVPSLEVLQNGSMAQKMPSLLAPEDCKRESVQAPQRGVGVQSTAHQSPAGADVCVICRPLLTPEASGRCSRTHTVLTSSGSHWKPRRPGKGRSPDLKLGPD